MTPKRNLQIGLLILGFALIFIFALVPTVREDLLKADKNIQFYVVSPRFFPYLASGLMALISAILIGHSWLKIKEFVNSSSDIDKDRLKPVMMSMALAVAYITVLPYLGVLIATPIFLLLYFWYYGFRKGFWPIILSIGVSALIYLCFAKIMMIPLPMGFLK